MKFACWLLLFLFPFVSAYSSSGGSFELALVEDSYGSSAMSAGVFESQVTAAQDASLAGPGFDLRVLPPFSTVTTTTATVGGGGGAGLYCAPPTKLVLLNNTYRCFTPPVITGEAEKEDLWFGLTATTWLVLGILALFGIMFFGRRKVWPPAYKKEEREMEKDWENDNFI